MNLPLAAVVFPTWQVVILILLCFSSLIIALYCLFFMVPLKSFVERINLLGGGMKGMEAHVEGVRSQTTQKLAAIEKLVHDELQRSRQDMQNSINSVAHHTDRLLDSFQRLEKTVQNLQTEISKTASDTRKTSAGLAAIHDEVESIKNEFSAVEGELRGAINRQVSDAYQKLESTVLSALEAVQDEMLLGACRLHGWQASRPLTAEASLSRTPKDVRSRSNGKIISAEPLFAEAEKANRSEEDSEEEREEALQTEGQSMPTG
jgi:uncharacterized protein YoxC